MEFCCYHNTRRNQEFSIRSYILIWEYNVSMHHTDIENRTKKYLCVVHWIFFLFRNCSQRKILQRMCNREKCLCENVIWLNTWEISWKWFYSNVHIILVRYYWPAHILFGFPTFCSFNPWVISPKCGFW